MSTLLGRPICHDATGMEGDDAPPKGRGGTQVVKDRHHGARHGLAAQCGHEAGLLAHVQMRGRLIDEQHVRLLGKRPCQRHALPLARRQSLDPARSEWLQGRGRQGGLHGGLVLLGPRRHPRTPGMASQ